MTDDLVKRPLDEEFDTMMEVQRNPHGAWEAIQTQAARIEALERERDAAYAIGYGDCENETSLTEIGKTNEFLHGQIAKYRDALATMTTERDEANEVIDKQGALLADAYGAILDWDEVLKERADHECKARLAKAVEALRKIAAEASVAVNVRKNGGINHKRLYEGWRKIAVERIDIARATLAEIEGGKNDE